MTAVSVQRVVVRMMFDATFRQRVYEDPALALRDVSLTDTERQWLVTPDPRAYGADEHRTSRALTGLLEEYLVAGALAIRMPSGIDCLYRFFQASVFHQCIQDRGSMADAFGRYLLSLEGRAPSDIGPIAALEQGIARVRRAITSHPQSAVNLTPQSWLQLAPRVSLLSVPTTTLSRYSDLLAHLSQYAATPLEAALDSSYVLPESEPVQDTVTASVMIDGTAGESGPSLEAVSEELGALLEHAQTGITCEKLCTVARILGATPDEALEIIQGLVDDQLLTLAVATPLHRS